MKAGLNYHMLNEAKGTYFQPWKSLGILRFLPLKSCEQILGS